MGALGSVVPSSLTAATAAVLLVDLQNDFLHPDGTSGRLGRFVPESRDILAPMRAFVAARRAEGMPVIFTRRIIGQGDAAASTSDLAAQREAYCRPGSWGAELIDDLRPDADDLVVDKPGASSFLRTDLADHLHALGRTHLLVAGVTLEVCVESTVRDAQDLGFSPVLLADLTWPNQGPQAEAAHARLQRHFSAVVASTDVDRHLAGTTTQSQGARS